MVIRVRIKLGRGRRLTRPEGRLVMASIHRWLGPLSAVACGLAMWRLSYDLKWTGRFAISGGFFSHWQVWLGAAIILQILAAKLQHHGRGGGAAAS